MKGSSSLKAVILIAAISSAIQGIVWCILSLMAIFCYGCVLKPGPYKFGNITRVTYKHYLAAYFQGACDENLEFYKQMNEVSSPEKILVIDVFVYIFNFILAIASIVVMFASRSKRKHIMLGWLTFYLVISFCVAVLDLIATGVVTSDYFAVSDSIKFKNSGLAGLSLIVLIMITTRGVFLWAANLVFSLYLISFICRSHKEELPVLSHTNRAFYRDETPTPPKSEQAFKIDSKAMDNRPIVILNSNGNERKLANEYPSYTAYSRWPRLHPDNKLVRSTTLPNPNQQTVEERQQKQQQLQQQLYHQLQQHLQQQQKERQQQQPQHQQQQHQQYVHQNRPPPPPAPVKPIYGAARLQNDVPPRNYDSGQSDMRPGSLQEAILTVRPLRQVRPRITAIPDGYP